MKTVPRIEVITGCMFAGKTRGLIARIQQLKHDKRQVTVVTPSIDRRYHAVGESHQIISHDSMRVEAIAVGEKIEEFSAMDISDVLAIDEAQFLSAEVLNHLIALPKVDLLVAAGLSLNWRGEPFGAMSRLLCYADKVTTLYATCVDCGALANRTRLSTQAPTQERKTVVVGGAEKYAPCCAACFSKWFDAAQPSMV